MGRELHCPKCGAHHALVNPGITMLVCSHCSTVLYWGEDEAVQIGAQSILPASEARLFLHATGRLGQRPFRVVGHLRYDHGRGQWDEWYLQMDDGGIAWVSEDARQLRHEQAAPVSRVPASAAELAVGMPLHIDDQVFTVREVGRAHCVGGEGQLPFPVLPGETYAYADIASVNGTRTGTLEYDDEARPTCFLGTPLGHDDLVIDGEPPPSMHGAPQGSSITCDNCGGALELPADRAVETRVCEYCGAQLELSGGQQTVLGVNLRDFDPGFVLEIGQAGTLDGIRLEVCGRMLYRDPEGYETREYLLFHPEHGYRWLAEDQGHFVLTQPSTAAPMTDLRHLSPRTDVRIGAERFRKYESGTVELKYVDGALPWVARTGQTFVYAEAIRPPRIFSAEYDAGEVEYFEGRYVEQAELWDAFGLEGRPIRGRGVAAAQPWGGTWVGATLAVLGLVLLVVNLGLAAWAMGQNGENVIRLSLDGSEYLEGVTSDPFSLADTDIVTVEVYAPVRDSWIALDLALLDEQDRVVAEMDGEVSYYSGYEGGESWSEGDKQVTRHFRAPAPGTYRVLVKGSGGSGRAGGPGGERVTLTLKRDAVLARYFLVGAGFALLFPLVVFGRRWLFERRRWAPVLEDDDDSDWDWDD